MNASVTYLNAVGLDLSIEISTKLACNIQLVDHTLMQDVMQLNLVAEGEIKLLKFYSTGGKTVTKHNIRVMKLPANCILKVDGRKIRYSSAISDNSTVIITKESTNYIVEITSPDN